MNEDTTNYSRHSSVNELLERFQSMVSKGEITYFDPEEFHTLVDYFNDKNDTEQADKVIEYALKMHPNNTEMLTLKFHSLVCENKLDEAEKIMSQIPTKDDYEYILTKAEYYLAKDEWTEADELLDELYESDSDAYTALDIADVYICYKRKENAEKWLAISGSKDSDDMEIVQTYAKFYFVFNEYEEAEPCLVRLLDENPYNLEAWQTLIRCRLLLDKIGQVQNDMEFAMAIDDKDSVNLELQGNLYIRLEKLGKAIACLEEAERLAKEKASARFALMNIYSAIQKYDKAITYSDYIIRSKTLSNEDLGRVFQLRGNAFIQMGKYEDGMINVVKGLEYSPEDAELHLLAGRIFLHDKSEEKAQECFSQAVMYAAHPDEAQISIGHCLLSEGYYEEAIMLFNIEFGVYENENKAEASYYLAFCYYKNKEEEKAVSSLTICLHYLNLYPQILNGLLPYDDEREFRTFIDSKAPGSFDAAFSNDFTD